MKLSEVIAVLQSELHRIGDPELLAFNFAGDKAPLRGVCVLPDNLLDLTTENSRQEKKP